MGAAVTCKIGLHDWHEPGPCQECRRETQRAYRRARAKAVRAQRGNRCINGHEYTRATSRWCVRQGHRYRLCLICQKQSFQATKRGEPGRPAASSLGSDTERTRLLLWLDEMRERAATWWERAELSQRIAELRA